MRLALPAIVLALALTATLAPTAGAVNACLGTPDLGAQACAFVGRAPEETCIALAWSVEGGQGSTSTCAGPGA
jgi:hypothetical protein